jgi:ligand-binding sensor domain-containing protein
MPRSIAVRLASLMLGAAMLAPAQTAQAGAWSTWIKMVTTNDMIALRDTVYLATGEAGIVRYLRSEDRFESVTREPGGLASNNVSVLTIDRVGRLWAGTAGKGVSRLAANGSSWDLVNAFDGLPSDSITVLRPDGDTIWVGTTRGIALWNGRQIAGSVPDIGTPSPFRSNVVTGIVVRGDVLFVATLDGLWTARLSQNLATWTETGSGLPVTSVAALATDGQQLFALANGVIYAWNAAGSSWNSATVPGFVDKLRDDFATVLAVTAGGLYRWSGTQWDYLPGCAGSSSGARFTEFAADPAGKVFETQPGTLLEQTAGTWIAREPPGPVDNDIQNVLYDGSRLWAAGHTRGISRFDGTTWRRFPIGCCGSAQDTAFVQPQECMTLQLDAAGRTWTSHWGAAIERITATTNPMHVDHVLVPAGQPAADTLVRHTFGWSSALDSWGYVYIGGDTPSRGVIEPVGIDVYDTSATRVINWKAANSGLRSNQVRGIAVDKSRTLWAGFAGAGVSWASLDTVDSDRSAPGNDHLRLPQFTAVASLATADIFGVVAHGDSIWVLTTANLQRIRTSSRLVSSTYEIPAGPAPRGAVHPLDVAPDGTVWVASVDGVRRYLPGGGSEDYRTDNSPLADNEVRSVYVEKATGAVWIGTASGVNRFDPKYRAPAPPGIARLSVKLWPNPATLTAMGTQVRLDANTPNLAGEVVDLGGRVLHRFAGVAAGGAVWNGRDSDGTLVRPGVYFVHVRGGGREAMVRVVVLR